VAVKRKTKRKLAPQSKRGTAIRFYIDDNLMARMNRFQSYMETENGMHLKNAPAVKFLLSQGLKEFENSNSQLNLLGEIKKRKKK